MADTPSKLPSFVAWPSFPFEGQMRTKRLEGPVPIEPAREGEDPSECTACKSPDDAYIWVSDRWRVRAMDRPSGLPMVLVLEARSHLDLGDLPNLLAAELGVMTVRLERAVRSLDGVERVHVNRWGDNAAHLHLWFLARPTGYLQLRGSFLSMWDDILEPVAEDVWRENLALVAAWLADFGGRAIAEPPRIEWHAPSHFEELGVTAVTGEGTRDDVPARTASRAVAGGAPTASPPASPALDPSGLTPAPGTPGAGPVPDMFARSPLASRAASDGVFPGAGTATVAAGPGAGPITVPAPVRPSPGAPAAIGLAAAGPAVGGRAATGPAAGGSDAAGPGVAGPGVAGHGVAGPGVAGPGIAGPAGGGPAASGEPVGAGGTGVEPKTFPGNGRPPQQGDDQTPLDGDGWGLSASEVAASDILSR